MIVPLKKLSLLLHHQEKEDFLKSLKEIGVVHIVEKADMASEELTKIQNELKRVDDIVRSLKKSSKTEKTSVRQTKPDDVSGIIRQYEELKKQKELINQKLSALNKDIELLSNWGHFEPSSISKLKSVNIDAVFYQISEKQFANLKLNDFHYEIINQNNSKVYFLVFFKDEILPIQEAEEIILPAISLKKAHQEKWTLHKQQNEIEQTLHGFITYQAALDDYLESQKEKIADNKAQLSMAGVLSEKVLQLTGWFPSKKEKAIRAFLNQFSLWYSIEKPGFDDDIPVLMKNRRFPGLFEPITRIFSLPDYFELDPTPFFAPLFMLFFGLCLGDLGYGLLLLCIGLIALWKVPKTAKPIALLISILGMMAMFTGLLLNTFFGHDIFAIAGTENAYFAEEFSLAVLGPVAGGKGMSFPAIPFVMYIGLIQIMLGMFMKGYNNYKLQGVTYALHPFANILMTIGVTIFLARINFLEMGKVQLGLLRLEPIFESLPANLEWFFIVAGLILLFLFNNPKKGAMAKFALGFWEFYQYISSIMGDALSYLRLFALGLAGGLLGGAFNQLAFMVITVQSTSTDAMVKELVRYDSPLIVLTILILLIGHTLNFGLTLLGAFVHPLRLTFVEFYKNLGFKGGAKPFVAFEKK